MHEESVLSVLVMTWLVFGTSGVTPGQSRHRVVAVNAFNIASGNAVREAAVPARKRQLANEIFNESRIVIGGHRDRAFVRPLDDGIDRT